MKLHAVCTLFPVMEGEQWEAFVADVYERGIQEPVTVWKGEVVDGQNRTLGLEAANRMRVGDGLKPWPLPTKEWDGQGSLIEYVYKQNFFRRQLSVRERAELGAKMVPLLEKEAEAAQRSGLRVGGDPGPVSGATNGKMPENSGRTREKVAKMVGVSEATIARMTRIQKRGTAKIKKDVATGRVSIQAGARLAGMTAEQKVAELERQKKAAAKKAHKYTLRATLGRAGQYLSTAETALDRAKATCEGYDCPRTRQFVEKAIDALAEETTRLVEAAERE
jgi:hypothetical protein